jgi:hypothetical protein
LIVNTRINNNIFRIIIDSGTTSSFIKPATAIANSIGTRQKRKSYYLNFVNRENIDYNKGIVDRETVSVGITIT